METNRVDQLLEEYIKDDFAKTFIKELLWCFEQFDDLYDEDKEVPKDNLCNMLMIMAWSIPTNPFVRHHADVLMPVLRQSILNWRTANIIEHQEKERRNAEGENLPEFGSLDRLIHSYVRRRSCFDIAEVIVDIASGSEKALEFAEKWVEAVHYGLDQSFQCYVDKVTAKERPKKE